MEWSRLLLNDVICSEHIAMHFQQGGNLSLVTMTFDIQTRPSERPNMPSHEFGANLLSSSRDISYTNKKITAPKSM